MRVNLNLNIQSPYGKNYSPGFSKNHFFQYYTLNNELSLKECLCDDNIDFLEEQRLLCSKFLSKDSCGNIFAHKADANEIKKMNKALFFYPELIHEIYTTGNKYGNLPAYTSNTKKIKEINKVLSPETFAKVYSHQNVFGDTVMSYFALNNKKKKEINKLIRKYTQNTKYLLPDSSLKLLEKNKAYLNDENMFRLFALSGRNS